VHAFFIVIRKAVAYRGASGAFCLGNKGGESLKPWQVSID
jgi:hypothetical protein